MQTENPLRWRKSVELRAAREKLQARIEDLRSQWTINVADRHNIERDGKACKANIARIDEELERRREWVRSQRVAEATLEPAAEREHFNPHWDELHLAVGTWS
jgi:DNA repair exonuclease SbcCD ATPase subunit